MQSYTRFDNSPKRADLRRACRRLAVVFCYWLLIAAPVTAETEPEVSASYAFEVAAGERLSGPALIKAKRGDLIELSLAVDRPDELHLHGYDRRVDLSRDAITAVRLQLYMAGRFEVELHRSHLPLTVIEVYPR